MARPKRRTTVVERAFAPLRGTPCWGVYAGHANMLGLQFGDPHLEVGEPPPSDTRAKRGRNRVARRRVFVQGAWALLTWTADWSIRLADGREATADSSDRAIRSVLASFDGQALVDCAIAARTLRMVLRFDLGGVLQIAPVRGRPRDDANIWTLHMPGDLALSVRADARYCRVAGNTPPDQWVARKLFRTPPSRSPS